IMAGLCRSIIENVFTKVIRISNVDSLGDRIVVQGGTFENDAVLCALEQYLGKEVIRAPYPGIMGAIGVALLTKEQHLRQGGKSSFIGLDAMDDFSYTREANLPCPFCTNHCKRAIVRFSNGNSWVTNTRCERG
ncbi:MAG: 2-hydroxyglutaryl-CoA dehydratase, partial [Lachnospiraceae bacterium]|nr:2-hydroxyglutaryl-CoA dehydratase [Lachnospiraceae bacterium]